MSDLFDCLSAINNKTKFEYHRKKCNGYMLVMWMSHDPALIGLCNDINPYVFSLPDDMIFKYFLKKVPKKKRYLKWTKKLKVSEAKETDIKSLMDDYELSTREAMLSLR